SPAAITVVVPQPRRGPPRSILHPAAGRRCEGRDAVFHRRYVRSPPAGRGAGARQAMPPIAPQAVPLRSPGKELTSVAMSRRQPAPDFGQWSLAQTDWKLPPRFALRAAAV